MSRTSLATVTASPFAPTKDNVHNLRRAQGGLLVCTARSCTFATMSEADGLTHVVQRQWDEYRPKVTVA